MTKRQKEVLNYLQDHPGSFIRFHETKSGRRCARIMGKDFSPFANYQLRIVWRLFALGKLTFEGGVLRLKQ